VSYSKNWLFKSESLWYDRWEQILSVQDQIPYIEVVTWNDYGESHYSEFVPPTLGSFSRRRC
jgi:hypothetical protein